MHPKSPHEPPLDSFGVDAVDRWFAGVEIREVIDFVNKLRT
jgi:hypothetical protein